MYGKNEEYRPYSENSVSLAILRREALRRIWKARLMPLPAGQRAIQAHYDRMGWPASVEMGEFPGIYRTHWNWDKTPSVTVMIPNKDHVSDLEKCLASIRKSKAYPDLEILIIENNSTEQETFFYYEKLKNKETAASLNCIIKRL